MANDNYKSLIYSRFDNLKQSYIDAKEIFKNTNVRNKLLHAGEYGAYREKICQDIIKACIPRKYTVSDGFIINSNNEISSQLDLIIYNENETPLIAINDKEMFFPVETIVGVGEIKSTLSTTELCKALIKLSNTKKLKRNISPDTFCIGDRNIKHDAENSIYDNIFSFIICEKITDFNYSELEKKLTENYNKNEIQHHFRHNVILSLKDGLIGYKDKNNDLQKTTDAIISNSFLYFPTANGIDLMYCLKTGRDAEKTFLISVANYVSNAKIYYPEPNGYL